MEGKTEAQRSLHHTANLELQLSSCDGQFIDFFFFFPPAVWSVFSCCDMQMAEEVESLLLDRNKK